MDFFFLIPLGFGVYMFFSLRRRSRHTGFPEWQKRWKNVDRARRKRIVRAVNAGRALPDPEDAQLALELIESGERFRQSVRGR